MIATRLNLFLFALATVASGASAAAAALTPIDTATQATFARPGKLVDIGGRRLNLVCSGSGQVTVVFDAYSGGAAWDWYEVQPLVARRTRACAYDRAGLGFSDPSPLPSISSNAVEDLHKLLAAAGIAPPYVLVGASYGGGNAQLFAYRYPKEVAGLVLAEPQHEDEFQRGNEITGGKLQEMQDQINLRDKACAAHANSGFAAGGEPWAECLGPIPERMGTALAAARFAVLKTPAFWKADLAEGANMDTSNAELRAARKPFGDLPMIVLSRGLPQFGTPGPKESPLSRAYEADNKKTHTEIAALSTRGSHRIIPGTGHIIAGQQPQAVVQAIEDILNMVAP
jgi:pimeloyl-ACP methyl ester carboxylesterase